MTRHLFNFLATASLLLCGALAVAWVRQPGHTSCFSTSLPRGRLLVVSTGRHLDLALWRDWPVLEWPAVHDHLGHAAADFCGPLFGVGGPAGTSYRGANLGLGVRREDVVAAYPLDGRGMPGWPERRAFQPAPGTTQVISLPPAPRLASFRRLQVPYWIALACTALLPALCLGVEARRLARRRRRRKSGLCPQCGYDLRATPGKCPECGAEPGGG